MMDTTQPTTLRLATDAGPANAARPASTAADPVCRRLSDAVGVPLLQVDALRRTVIGGDAPPWVPEEVFEQLEDLNTAGRVPSRAAVDVVAAPLVGGGYAVALLPFPDREAPAEAVIAAAAAGWTNAALQSWWARAAGADANAVTRSLSVALESASTSEQLERLEWELESMAEQIDSTYEEISLLHFLAQNLHVSQETSELATLCLARMRESLTCGGAVMWLESPDSADSFRVDGESPVDELGLAMLLSRFDRHPWPQPLVRNHMGDEGLANMVVVPVMSGERRSGWIACFNADGGREFGTVEASLVASVAVSIGTHLRNAAVVHEQEEMLLSFVRSLVSSLDAKDPYTRGHSERVAAIARRLAQQIGLADADVESIYLAGLLHDVGKIGVSDGVLTKPGRLTDAEFEEIQQHPSIGYQILGGISRLKHVLPGVRSHHEAMDGTGYPDALQGDEIPLMARVLAVADSYDAMGSDRPYRKGMPLEKLERILRDGAGSQWDTAIIDAYFACRDDVMTICVDWTARQIA